MTDPDRVRVVTEALDLNELEKVTNEAIAEMSKGATWREPYFTHWMPLPPLPAPPPETGSGG